MCCMMPATTRPSRRTGVDIEFDGAFEELVDQTGCSGDASTAWRHVAVERLAVVDDFHGAAAQHERGPHDHGIADAVGDDFGLFEETSPSRFPAGAGRAFDEFAEFACGLRRGRCCGRGADDGHARGRPALRRGSAASARQTARSRRGFFAVDNVQHVFEVTGSKYSRSEVS
jgi:hypothetical protein